MSGQINYHNVILYFRIVVGNWLKYSKWEESQGEIQRARSVYERALDVDHRNPTLWLRYAEMEMRCRQVKKTIAILNSNLPEHLNFKTVCIINLVLFFVYR